MMSWLLDCIPVVGTVYRACNAVAAHIAGDHKEVNRHWVEAGMDVAGIAPGLVTGGAGKVETTATRVGAKAAKMSPYGIWEGEGDREREREKKKGERGREEGENW